MANDINQILGNRLNEVQIDISFIKPDAIYSYDLYDEYGNVILTSNTPLTKKLLDHLKSNNIQYLFYNPTRRAEGAGAGRTGYKGLINAETQKKTTANTIDFLEHIREIFSRPGEEQKISRERIDRSRAVVESLLNEIDVNADGIFQPLMEMKNLDEYNYNHSTNVSILAALLGTKLEYSREVRAAMGVGGLFHDIGKLSVAKEILNKDGKLDETEFNFIKEHPHVGYKLVEKNPFVKDLEKQIVLLHHEKADGTGYPYGVDPDHFQNRIPKEVRLVALCDVYAALVSKRPYGEPYSGKKALRLMLNMVYAPYKKIYQFLPTDFRDFIRSLGASLDPEGYFLGSGDMVRISTGEVAVIEEMNKLYPLNPRIRLLTTRELQPVKRQIQIDMLKELSSYIANVYDKSTKDSKVQA